ncbi:MAG TPA: hypothetical protein PK011_13080, partial [Marinagarivorans sp.]|nr:hypothetical protein [Marinagarivorans sp.]
MKYLIALTTLTSALLSGEANAWEHRHHHHSDADAAVALIGGIVLGAALADSGNRSSYSSTRYYSDYPSRYTSSTTYYPQRYYSEPYYTERVYITEPVTRTTTYYGPVTYSAPRYQYPKRKPVERAYYDETLRDEYGNCYSV